jgi:hypothetical protein
MISPEVLQGHDDGLEVERRGHGGSFRGDGKILVRKIITANRVGRV